MAQTALQLIALFQHLQKSTPVTQVHHRHHSLSQKLCLLQTPQHLHSLQPKDFGATAQALFCMQVSVVEQACINYLLSLNLEPRQLLDMASLFDTLGKPAAYKQSLQKLFEMPWTEQVMAVIAEACSNLLDQGTVGMELCRELLHSTKRGALCEMQVSAAVMNNLYMCCDEQLVYMSAVLLLLTFPMFTAIVSTAAHVQASFVADAVLSAAESFFNSCCALLVQLVLLHAWQCL